RPSQNKDFRSFTFNKAGVFRFPTLPSCPGDSAILSPNAYCGKWQELHEMVFEPDNMGSKNKTFPNCSIGFKVYAAEDGSGASGKASSSIHATPDSIHGFGHSPIGFSYILRRLSGLTSFATMLPDKGCLFH